MFSVIGFSVLAVVLLSCTFVLWKRPGEGIGLPLIAILCFGYLFVQMPLYLIWNGTMEMFLNDWQVGKAVVVAAVMLACFVWGWWTGTLRSTRMPATSARWNPVHLWNHGFAAATVGFVLLLALVRFSGGVGEAFGSIHGRGFANRQTTAYWYYSPWWIVCGITMMVMGSARLRAAKWRRVVIVGFVVILYTYSILLSLRGMTFALTAALLVSYTLGRKIRPLIVKTLPFWIAAGLAVLLIFGYREVLHLGDDRPEAPGMAKALTRASDIDDAHGALRMTGNEFIYHALVLDTVDELQKYDLGLQWLYTYTLHPIPRIWWPEKPYGFDSTGITWDDIYAVTGVRIAGGSAAGVVADIYANFGPVSPLFFFLFGWVSGKFCGRAQLRGDPMTGCAYALLVAFSLNLFAQGFGALLVMYPYSMAPLFLYYLRTQLFLRRERSCTLGTGGRFTGRRNQALGVENELTPCA